MASALVEYTEHSLCIICKTSFTKGAKFFPSGNTIGQNVAYLQYWTTKVPQLLQLPACCSTLGTILTGGHHQLFSPAQLTVNASIASVPGHQYLNLSYNY